MMQDEHPGHSDGSARREALLDAALPHVPFDGWSDVAFRAAAADAGIALPLARVICPRGAVDLAVAYHRRGDRAMRARLAAEDLAGLRLRDRVAAALRFRLEAADREVVRRGAALFALPQHAATGARLVLETADAVWTALGDASDDINWYTRRLSLGAVWSATLLYWMGDDSEGQAETWAFLDRRIEAVMRFEKARAGLTGNGLFRAVFAGPLRLAGRIRPPVAAAADLPGREGLR